MAVTTAYTTEALINRLVGRLGIDLRSDDAVDVDEADDMMQDAIDTGTVELDFYLARYSVASIAASEWCIQHATWFAVRRWCQRRLNEVPASVEKECKRREDQLLLVLQRKVPAPRLTASRRPAVVTTHTVILRNYNNQVRVDPSRSTGVAQDYRRVIDETAPDNR